MPRSVPSVWPVVFDAIGSAPPHVRRIVGGALVGWLALLVLQAVDSSSAPGAAGLAEFLSARFGATGGLLLVLAALLEARARAGAAPTTDPEALRRVLFALPALALVSAVFVSAAITLMIVRALLGAAAPFVMLMTASYAGVLWVARHMVVRAARTLYEHAATESAVAAGARVEARSASLARRGLTPNDSRALFSLDTRTGRSMRSLADEWQCDPSNATFIVDRLEEMGLASRQPLLHDKRVKLVVLTRKGEKTRTDLLHEFHHPPAEFAGLSQPDLEALERIVSKLRPGLMPAVASRHR